MDPDLVTPTSPEEETKTEAVVEATEEVKEPEAVVEEEKVEEVKEEPSELTVNGLSEAVLVELDTVKNNYAKLQTEHQALLKSYERLVFNRGGGTVTVSNNAVNNTSAEVDATAGYVKPRQLSELNLF